MTMKQLFIIQHHTTPCHVSRLIRKYLEENDVFTMEWPAQSHDIDIIVNIWLTVKRKIHSDAGEIKSNGDIIERFLSAWNETTQLEIEKLYASLPSHCKEIIFNTVFMFKHQLLK